MHRLLLLVLFIVGSLGAGAHNVHDTISLVRYLRLAEQHSVSAPTIVPLYADSVLAMLKSIDDPKIVASSLTRLGSVYRTMAEFGKALPLYQKAVEISPASSPWLADTYLEAGIVLLRISELDSSMQMLQRGLNIAKTSGDPLMEASIYNMMGNVKRAQNQYNEALGFYIESIKLFESRADHKGLTQALSNAGNIHNLLGDTTLAMSYAKRSLASAKAAGVQSSIAYSSALIGRIFRRMGRLDEALAAYLEAARVYHEINFRRETGEIFLSIGNIYFDKNEHRQAFNEYMKSLRISKGIGDSLMMTHGYVSAASALVYLKEYSEARPYVDSTMTIARKKKLATQLMDAYQVMSELLEGEGDYRKSKEYYVRFIDLRDSLTAVQNKQKAQETEARFQSERKDNAIRLLNAENELREAQQLYLTIFALLVIAVAVVIYNRYKIKLRANEKLQELDQMKSRFFTNVSHEFRTPLTLILGPLERLIDESDTDEERENLLLMQRNARRLQRLINQLLDISRIESGTMELHLEESDIAHTLRVVGSTFSSLAETKGILFEQDILSERIACYDKDKLEKIVINLLSNAFKFTPEGGQVSLSCSIENDMLSVEVSDTGIGIPKQFRGAYFRSVLPD